MSLPAISACASCRLGEFAHSTFAAGAPNGISPPHSCTAGSLASTTRSSRSSTSAAPAAAPNARRSTSSSAIADALRRAATSRVYRDRVGRFASVAVVSSVRFSGAVGSAFPSACGRYGGCNSPTHAELRPRACAEPSGGCRACAGCSHELQGRLRDQRAAIQSGRHRAGIASADVRSRAPAGRIGRRGASWFSARDANVRAPAGPQPERTPSSGMPRTLPRRSSAAGEARPMRSHFCAFPTSRTGRQPSARKPAAEIRGHRDVH